MAAQQAQGNNTWTWDQHQQLSSISDRATRLHLSAAAEFVSQIMQANAIPFAIMGGFAIQIRGSPRETYDVDIAVGCNMGRLLEVISGQPR